MKKAIIFLAGCALLLLAGCPRAAGGGKSYTVNFSAGENGTLSAKIKNGEAFTSGKPVPENTVLEFTAVPNSGYKVEKWEGATADTTDNKKATLTVTKDITVKVVFVKDSTPQPPTPPPASEEYTVKFSAEPTAGGTLTAKIKDSGADFASGNKLAKNTVLEFTATPKEGYKVKEWTDGGAGLSISPDKKTATLTINSEVTVKVTFAASIKREIKFSVEGTGGNLTAKIKNGATITSGTSVDEQTTIVFTAEPSTDGKGYYVEGWTGTGLKISEDRRTAELIVTENANVKVKFREYTIENTNWDATGKIITANGTEKNLRLVISDRNTLTLFDTAQGSSSYLARVSYDSNTKILSFVNNQGGSGSIKITPTSAALPTDWQIELTGVKVGDLELQDQTVPVNVTFSDGTIK